MVVSNEDMRFRGAAGGWGSSAIAQHAQAGAAIENELRAIGSDQFEARRVSAVAPRRGVNRRRGASHTPKTELGNGSGHVSPRTGLARR